LDETDKIYVANGGNHSVPVYAANANGNIPPIQTISGSKTGLTEPLGIAVH
jgi:hypothetical protein